MICCASAKGVADRPRPEVPARLATGFGPPPEPPRPWWLRLAAAMFMLTANIALACVLLPLVPVLALLVCARHVLFSTHRLRRDPRDLRVAVVGGGWSGLGCLNRLKELGVEHATVFEARDDVGGTWHPTQAYHRTEFNPLAQLSVLTAFFYSLLSPTFASLLLWAADYLVCISDWHLDLDRNHFGTLDCDQRRQAALVPFKAGDIASFTREGVQLRTGELLECDVLLFATGFHTGFSDLAIKRDGAPFDMGDSVQLYNHFVHPQIPVLASSTAFLTTIGPVRGDNAADMAVYSLCVERELTEAEMVRSASRNLGPPTSLNTSSLFATGQNFISTLILMHLSLIAGGIVPLPAFILVKIQIFLKNAKYCKISSCHICSLVY
ncbi:hypothetical protein T492DRAFT_1004778 [Pavlovales sp. CCMP2436]|nr:hypothetical protein T492DRAFT_1004778 [Pavlovales sp. CCMP2436]